MGPSAAKFIMLLEKELRPEVATLKDIAEQVGVSISTVSRVINNDTGRHISEETKKKVWKAARELGYTPNESARRLVTGEAKPASKHRRIGCIVSAPQNKYNHPYFSPILEGIEKKLGDLGYTLASVLSLEEIRKDHVFHEKISSGGLDGIIVVEGMDSSLYEYLKTQVSAIVGIDLADASVPVVGYDRIEAAFAAVSHLVAQGHRKFGFIGGSGLARNMEREKRFRGYRAALEESGITPRPEWELNAGWDASESYRLVREMLERCGKDRPTAIFAASDMLAISAMRAVSEGGLKIPQDIAFVGLDNIEMSQYTFPPLTTIHIPKEEIGMMAAKTVVDVLEGHCPLPYKIWMPFELKVRASSVSNKTD